MITVASLELSGAAERSCSSSGKASMSGMRRPSSAGPGTIGSDRVAACLGCPFGPSAMISAFFGEAHDAKPIARKRMNGFFTESRV